MAAGARIQGRGHPARGYAADISEHIKFKYPAAGIPVFGADFKGKMVPGLEGVGEYGFCFPNETMLVDITLPRAPGAKVFELRKG